MKISTRDLVLVSLFTALMIAGAFVRIPFPLLPVTFQAFVCALAGLFLGPRLGAISMIVYALLGLAGVPVFSQGGGISYVFNGSFGFILGFIPGAYVIGKLSGKNSKTNRKALVAASLAGLAAIYAVGMTYMLIILKFYAGNANANLLYVFTVNMPYIVKDAILFTVAALAAFYILPQLKRIKHY